MASAAVPFSAPSRRESARALIVALRISQSTSLAVGIFNVLLGPNISARHAVGDHTGLRNLAGRYARVIVAVNLLTLLPVVILSRPLVRLFGPAFEAAAMPLLILCAGQFVNSLAGPAGNLLINCGLESKSARILALTCSLNIALNLALIPRYGAMGAALASAIALAVKSLLMVWVCVDHLRVNPTLFSFFASRDAAGNR